VDAGLRWEFYLPPTPAIPVAGRITILRTTRCAGRVGGNPLTWAANLPALLRAALGLAYRLTEQTVLRGAFGISYAPFTNNQYAFITHSAPIRTQASQWQALPSCKVPGQQGDWIPAPGHRRAAGGLVAARPGESYTVVDKHFQERYVESWNLASSVRCQRVLPWGRLRGQSGVKNSDGL